MLPFRNMPYRVQTVAVRLLVDYADYCTGVAGFFALRCTGKVQEARAAYNAFKEEFGKRELSIERYYDHFEATHAFLQMFYKK